MIWVLFWTAKSTVEAFELDGWSLSFVPLNSKDSFVSRLLAVRELFSRGWMEIKKRSALNLWRCKDHILARLFSFTLIEIYSFLNIKYNFENIFHASKILNELFNTFIDDYIKYVPWLKVWNINMYLTNSILFNL